jgi:hypothetical protein
MGFLVGHKIFFCLRKNTFQRLAEDHRRRDFRALPAAFKSGVGFSGSKILSDASPSKAAVFFPIARMPG